MKYGLHFNLEDTNEKKLSELISQIGDLDNEVMAKAKERQDYRVKVPGSLGQLEDISIRIAGITGKVYDNDVTKQAIVIMSADNGVVEEGVASAPQTVTLMQTINFTKRITGVGSQAKYFGIDILDIDTGVRLPIPQEYLTEDMLTEEGELAKLVVNRRLANGTKNLAKEPAMSREDAVKAFLIGFEAAKAVKDAGKTLYGVGEMGIGNSTTAACIICAITGAPVDEVIGRGGGLNDEGLRLKNKVVADAVERYGQEGADIIDVARSLGGFDICAMAGAYLGAGVYRIPVVADGYISIAGALLAVAIEPKIKNFLFTSHKSHEPGYVAAAEYIGIPPMFDLGMRLGEGSGCPIAFKVIEAGCAAMNLMSSLDEGSIDSDYLNELREKNLF